MFTGLQIVIVNWNLKDDTLACVESLIASGASPEQIILIDNGSSDGSVAEFRQRFRNRLTIIENPVNIYYAPACNQGIHQALSLGAEWILLINNDTIVDIGFLSALESSVNNPENRYKILAPIILYYSEPEMIWYVGDHLIKGTLFTTNRYRGRNAIDLDPIIPVDFVNGCGMLVHQSVFKEIGVFDPSLLMYGEEVDFCCRARRAGFKFACITSAKMWHKISVSANRDKPRTAYLRIRNQIKIYRRYSTPIQLPIMFIFSSLRVILISIQDVFTGKGRLIPAFFQGWKDGWFQSMGLVT